MRKKPIPAIGKVDYHGNYSAPLAADVEKAVSVEKDAMAYYTSHWKDDANSISYEPVVEAYCKGHEDGSSYERSKLPELIAELQKLIPIKSTDQEYRFAYEDGVSDAIITIKKYLTI